MTLEKILIYMIRSGFDLFRIRIWIRPFWNTDSDSTFLKYESRSGATTLVSSQYPCGKSNSELIMQLIKPGWFYQMLAHTTLRICEVKKVLSKGGKNFLGKCHKPVKWPITLHKCASHYKQPSNRTMNQTMMIWIRNTNNQLIDF